MDKSQKIMWDELSGYIVWDVAIRHNIWNGRYYCDGTYPFRILAGSSNEALSFVKNNMDIVEESLRKVRMRRGSGTIRLIRVSDKFKARAKQVGCARKSSLLSGPVMNTHYEMINYEKK